MKKTILVTTVLVLAICVSGYTIGRVFFDQPVAASGYLQPESVTQLNFATSAPIVEVSVRPGDVVRAGDVLAKQDTAPLEAKVDALEAALAADEVALQSEQDPARQDDEAFQLATAAAQAQLDAARAKASEAVETQDTLVAKAADEVETARATLAAAEQQAESNASACSTAAGSTSTASSTEGVVEGGPPITLPPVTNPALMTSCSGLARQVTQDRARVTQAESAYNAAVVKRQASTGTLESRLTQVQRELEHTLGREPAGNRANLVSAQAAVAKDTVEIEEARAALDAAVLVAPDDGVVSSVGGEVGEVAGAEGVRVFGAPQPLPEKASSGINLFPPAPQQPTQQTSQFDSMITLGSASLEVVAQVSEDDLNEISSEQSATVTFPAIPGESFTGEVSHVEPQAVNLDGNVFFLVEVSLSRQPDTAFTAPQSMRLAGLTANVRF